MEQQAPAQQGGGVVEALLETDKRLFSIVQAISQAGVPDEVKGMFAQSLEAFRAGLEALTGAGGAEQPQQNQVATPEQGANPNAVPAGMGGR